jgi:hypothetical protein
MVVACSRCSSRSGHERRRRLRARAELGRHRADQSERRHRKSGNDVTAKIKNRT